VLPVAKDMKGYFDFYMFDCQDPAFIDTPNFGGCDANMNQAMSPMMAIVVPPEVEKNPYTGEPMKRSIVSFPPN
jgi:hypothetical protein